MPTAVVLDFFIMLAKSNKSPVLYNIWVHRGMQMGDLTSSRLYFHRDGWWVQAVRE